MQKESQVYSDAKSLEEFLDMLLEKWVPTLAYDDTAPNSEPAPKRMRRAQQDWPEPLTPLPPAQTPTLPPPNSDLLQLWTNVSIDTPFEVGVHKFLISRDKKIH